MPKLFKRFTSEHGAVYEPFASYPIIGFKVTKNGRVSYLYLNPSGEDSDGQDNVFVYQGPAGDPALDTPVVFVPIDGD